MTPEMLRLFTFLFSYRHGKPGARREKDSGKKSLVFVSHPWMTDPMKDQEAAAIAGQQAQDKIEAAAPERNLQGKPADAVDDEDPDAPQLVR